MPARIAEHAPVAAPARTCREADGEQRGPSSAGSPPEAVVRRSSAETNGGKLTRQRCVQVVVAGVAVARCIFELIVVGDGLWVTGFGSRAQGPTQLLAAIVRMASSRRLRRAA